MSQQARAALVASRNTFFQAASQRNDLLDETITKTELIALLSDLVAEGWKIEFTAIKSDHHDDSNLGTHCHFNGYCADLWPLNSFVAGDYMDAASPQFQAFLKAIAASPWLYQIGLVGDGADSPANFAAAGPTAFQDDGGAHVHVGANG
jgi:hypothetical protein